MTRAFDINEKSLARRFGEKLAFEMPLVRNLLNNGVDDYTKFLALPPAIGALAGGLYGAYQAPKGKKLKHGLMGAGIGGALGLGGALVGDALIGPGNHAGSWLTGSGAKLRDTAQKLDETNAHNDAIAAAEPKFPDTTADPKERDFNVWLKQTKADNAAIAKYVDDLRKWKATPHEEFRDIAEPSNNYQAALAADTRNRTLGEWAGYLTGVSGAAAGGAGLALRARNKKRQQKKAAFAFGEKLALDLRLPNDYTAARQTAISSLIGALISGGRGYLDPGYDEKLNEHGHVIAKKKRNPWRAAAESALIGAGTGALGSYAAQFAHKYDPEIDTLLGRAAASSSHSSPPPAQPTQLKVTP